MVKLKRYLASEGIKHNVFAEKIGFSPGYLHKIIYGILLPNLTAARRIDEITGKRVSVYDWDIKPKEKKDKKRKKKTKDKSQANNPEISVILKP